DAYNWIGTPASYSDNSYVFFIRTSLPYKSIEEIRKAGPELNIGNVGTAITEVIPEALGIKMKIVRGYTSDQLNLAVERGEVDGRALAYANIAADFPHWIDPQKPLIRLLA